ncbi:MAG TPA: 50S ribosomal protein L11 [Acidimicrobiales bacterium]|jgi:large subunit ribosomal protein L11|nr:50S ribosomal protein L11 [Acidimicrobiales bacterium]
MAVRPAKRITRVIRIELEAGKASPADLGKALGPAGVNLGEVLNRYNQMTAESRGDIVPVDVTIFEDRSVELTLRTPPTAFLVRKALGIDKGSARPGAESAATMSRQQLRDLATMKLADLNTDDIEVAEKIIAGTARSMGVALADA